jgi:transposase InsO family protein
MVMHEAHDAITAGHLGVVKTKAALSSHFWWPSLYEDVKAYVQACVSCQKKKPRNHDPYGSLQPLENPCQPWEHVHIDFFGPFPATTKGFTYGMSVSDRLTRMVHFLPCSKTITGADAAALFTSQVFRLHGLPKKIISDRDPRFTSEFWQGLFKTLGTKQAMSTTLHPQIDGVAERNHRSIEAMLNTCR